MRTLRLPEPLTVSRRQSENREREVVQLLQRGGEVPLGGLPRMRPTAAGAHLAAVVALVAALSACSSSTPDPVPSPFPSLRIMQHDDANPSGMEARLEGTLTVDARGCVGVGKTASDVSLVWPRGYTVRGDAVSFEVLDGDENVVARSGVPIAMGGGGIGDFPDSWTERDCHAGNGVWLVGEIEPL